MSTTPPTTLQSEPAEIVGGPLCGLKLSVVAGKPSFQCGKTTVKDASLKNEDNKPGAVWMQGIHEIDTYVRSLNHDGTDQKTAAGRVIFRPASAPH